MSSIFRAPGSFGASAASTARPGLVNTSNTGSQAASSDIEVNPSPPDGISSLDWSSAADFLVSGCWDNNVRIYGVEGAGAVPKAMYSHEGPVLDTIWSKDGLRVISGSADKTAKLYDVQSGQSNQVAAHDAPIKHVRWVDQGNGLLATASWDKTVKYWDMRQGNPIAQATLSERCYAMDCEWPYLVVGTADRKIHVFDLQQNPNAPAFSIDSPLKYQTRTIACFRRAPEVGLEPMAPGFALGSIEGRVAIQYFKDEHKGSNFSFKCHRKEPPTGSREPAVVCPVNEISFTPQGTFSTCGSDGTFTFWDKDARTRLKTFDRKAAPISATAFNRDGKIFAYAVSYDWHAGHQMANPPNSGKDKIYLLPVAEEDIRRKPPKR
ncbi:WD40 repeat-like protein [Ceraceosorus guamensis]|uniref:WD40 repeat-like protein n=1 Tax=Ceraceosorus guamensis TaxID=1522189 RepID=A0A316VRW3_9BASI|nr:WD40 repeat-like protein [Ceraceosorus guamensis]PWN39954.1 WD40 repeat-like protein [Ceraceosorus guamensis]